MSVNAKWVPMKWPCGPLEIARLIKSKSVDAELKKTAEAWAQPSALQLLKGTPVNCLIVDWASGTAEDVAQQLALKPLIHAGRQLGLSFVGKVSAKENLAAMVAAGREAGLEAVILEGSGSQTLDLPVIVQFPSDNVEWDNTTSIFSTTGNAWPGVNLKTMEGDTAIAGPTGVPWVDSNGWFSLLARQMASGKTLWLDIDPPDSPHALPAEDYCLAIADSRVYASRWVISLDNKMRAAIVKRDPRAMEAWGRICETLSFFGAHAEWEAYKPMGALAVVSDFKGPNAFPSGEVLNLLNRGQVQFLIIDRAHLLASQLEGLKGILWMDDEAPSPEQHDQLLAFVQQGGLVIAAKYWGPPGVTPYKENWLFGYNIYGVLKGKIVVAESGLPDPYQLASDAHLLVSRRNDFARLYNPATTNCFASIDPDGRKQVVQVLNYSKDVASYVTLWVNSKARAGKLWRRAPHVSSPIEGALANDGTEFDLPPLSVHCAVEIERLA
jgi:hypothetical protein